MWKEENEANHKSSDGMSVTPCLRDLGESQSKLVSKAEEIGIGDFAARPRCEHNYSLRYI